MKTTLKTALILLCAIFSCLVLKAADELDNYTNLLNRAESGFWRAVFARNSSALLKNYLNILNNLDNSARKIYELRRKNGSIANYGDLARPGILLKTLVNHQQNFSRSTNTSIRDKKTTIAEYNKVLRQATGKRIQATGIESVSLTRYAQFLKEIKDSNIEMLDNKLKVSSNNNSNSGLNRHQNSSIIEIGNQDYTIITEARLTIAKMRQMDPLFKRKPAEKNSTRRGR
ncbi:MAG: hypothetical protein J6R86_00785 [Lentisphaeria bacterium]|nr:hypothetical protein [Lentisphaeria bacterium]